MQLVKDIKEIIDKLLPLAEISEKEVEDSEINEILENPEKIVDELKTIYDSLVNISANHSYHTFFIINTRGIPRYYIEQAYPRLKDRFEDVSEFLGLEKKFFLDVKEGKIKRDYTMWGHKENGLAYLIYKLNGILWLYFEKEEFRKLFELITSNAEDLRQKYYENAKKSLDGIGWKFPDYVQITNDYTQSHYYIISGLMLVERRFRIRDIRRDRNRNNYWYDTNDYKQSDENKSLLKLIDDLSPALFILPEPKKTLVDNRYHRYSDGIKIEFEENMLELIEGI